MFGIGIGFKNELKKVIRYIDIHLDENWDYIEQLEDRIVGLEKALTALEKYHKLDYIVPDDMQDPYYRKVRKK